MALINIQNLKLAFGGPPIFNGINLSIERGDRATFIGRNGAGKSTLLRLIEGSIQPDSGTVMIQKGIRTTFLSQDVPSDVKGTVFDVVASGLKECFDLVSQYHSINSRLATESTPILLEELNRIHSKLDTEGGWEIQQQVDKIISQLGLNPDLTFNSLSAGLKRQVLFGKALAGRPDILLLDEPTNHMDIDSIIRIEEFLIRFPGTLIFVTHDRLFLRKVATRIVEIDRGTLFDQSCDYDTFLIRVQAAQEVKEAENALFDKKLAKEEKWVRQGIKARRTRNEGRVRQLKKLREKQADRRERIGVVKMNVHAAGQSGKIVVDANDICFGYDETPIISNFSVSVQRGDRIGIFGPNGVGKTTIISILLGNLKPLSGKIRIGEGLRLSYFDQMREQLDETKTVRENVGEGKDVVTINGKERHIIGYLKDFLFSPDRALSPVSILSGGERNRLLLARLFTRPSNLLVLDEPTNDLDAETLELLEDLLMKYTGTILLISHDREFINNVVTSTIVFEGQGVVKEYIGGYDDWQRQQKEKKAAEKIKFAKKENQPAPVPKKKQKMGYKQQRELESLPQKIESLETEQEKLFHAMSEPDFHKNGKSKILEITEKLEAIKKALSQSYKRWEELEEIKAGL